MSFRPIKKIASSLRCATLLAMTLLISSSFVYAQQVIAQQSVKESDQLDFAQGLLSRGIYDMAVLQYQKFITEYPHSSSLPEAYLSLGESYFLSQDLNKAFDAFNQFIKLFPDSDQLPLSVLRLGQIDIQQRKYDEAVKFLTSIEPENKLKGQMLQSFDYYSGEAYLGEGNTAAALDLFQKAALVPGALDYTAYALEETGKILVKNSQYSEAIDAYGRSIKIAEDTALKAELTYRIAEAKFLSGQYADAIKEFQAVIDQYPGYGFTQDALANMLLAYFNLGQYEPLLSAYQKNAKQIKEDEAYFTVHYAAVLATIELKEFDQANVLLDRILAFSNLKPQERAKVFIKKADILIRQKKYKDGQALLDAYSSENVDNPDENLFLKAETLFGIGQYDKAFNLFENVYINFPSSRFSKAALLGQAHARQETGRFKESEALFLKYYEIQDQADLKSDSLYDAIVMAVKSGDISTAISSAREYLKVFPAGDRYSDVVFLLADNLDKNNQPQDAVDLLQGYLNGPKPLQKPNSANFLLGFNLQLLGKNDQALSAYIQVDEHKEDGKFFSDSLKNIAIIYLGQKNMEKARIYFDRLISQPDTNDLQIKTYIWVCNEYLKGQKFDDVLRIGSLAEKHFSAKDLLEIKYFEAEALRGLGRCDEAIADYGLVAASTEKNAYTGSAHIGYGLCLADSKKFDLAAQEYQKALDENMDDFTVTAHARFEMANLESAQGHLDQAFKIYLLIATIYDDNYFCSESLLRAGRISEEQQRKADAIKMYGEILDKYKDSPAAKSAKERLDLLK